MPITDLSNGKCQPPFRITILANYEAKLQILQNKFLRGPSLLRKSPLGETISQTHVWTPLPFKEFDIKYELIRDFVQIF
jgi:hypothetical protein